MADRSLREIFCVDEVLPEEQELITVDPRTTVSAAIEIMRENSFSALPVIQDRRVVGVFSFRSFALGLAEAAGVESDVLMSISERTSAANGATRLVFTERFGG